MKTKFNVIKNEITEALGIDFAPKKNKPSDIAYDIRAYCIIEKGYLITDSKDGSEILFYAYEKNDLNDFLVQENLQHDYKLNSDQYKFDYTDKFYEDFKEYNLKPNQFVIIGIGASLKQQESVQLLKPESLMPFAELIGNIQRFLTNQFDVNEFNNNIDKIEKKYFNVEKTKDYELKFYPSSEMHTRSGHAFNYSLEVYNGQIDNLYDNMIRVKITNNSSQNYIIQQGERIGQLEIKLVPESEDEIEYYKTISELNGGGRSGFGSSGIL